MPRFVYTCGVTPEPLFSHAAHGQTRKEIYNMQENQWLQDWLPTAAHVNTRSMPPGTHERAAVASAAHRFTLALCQLAEEIENDQDDPKDAAQAITATAAVLDNYVSTVTEYINQQSDEENYDQWDDKTPEGLLTKARLDLARSAADTLAVRAQNRLLEAGLPISRHNSSPFQETDIAQENRLYQQIVKYTDTAAAVGHCAALKWLINELHEKDNTTEPNQKTSLVLAMWPNEENLMRLRNKELPRHAKETVDSSIEELMNCAWCVEEHRPVFVTSLADPQWHNGRAQELISEFPNVGPEAAAMYSWKDDDTQQAIMAYRYQGSTHVKLVREPYEHPITMQDALENCHSLELAATELRDEDEPEGPHAQAIRNMLSMAAINRTLALLGYQHESRATLEHAVRIAMQHGTTTQAYNLVNAIYDEQAQTVIESAANHGLDKSPLTATQAREAVTAARLAGASDDALRHMASILNVPEDDAHQIGIPEPEPVPWEHAQDIIRNICGTYPPADQERWDRITTATGWPPEHPNVQRLRKTLTTEFIDSLDDE